MVWNINLCRHENIVVATYLTLVIFSDYVFAAGSWTKEEFRALTLHIFPLKRRTYA